MDQLSFVEHLARKYKTKGDNSRCWSDYLKAHGLANSCVALDPRDERHKLVYDIEESWYQGNHPLTYNEHRDLTRRHKKALVSYRRKVKDEFDNLQQKETSLSFSEIFSETNKSLLVDFTQDIFRVSEMCTDGFVGVTREIIEDSISVLERVDMKAPCHFSVCALGSVAKGEVTPYSDLEYAFIVERDDEYFTRLAVDTYFRVGNIGESPLSTFDIQELRESGPLADLETVGFRIDGIKEKAGNIPTGRVGGQRLTLTVEGFMELYKTAANAPFDGMAGDKSDMISSLSLVYSSQGSECSLYPGLKSAIARYEESLGSVHVNRKRLHSFSHDIHSYNYLPKHSLFGSATGVGLKIKPHIFRYPTLLANNFRVCLNLDSSFSWNIFTSLKERSVISEDIHFYLTVAIALSIYIRTKVYMSFNSQSELVSLFTSSVPDDPHIYHLSQNLFLLLGYFTIPIKRCIRQSLRQCYHSVNEGVDLKEIVGSMVSNIVVDRDDFMLKVELLYFVEDYRSVLMELSRVAGSNIESVSCERFIEILRRKYNTTKSDKREVEYLELVALALVHNAHYKTAIDYNSWLVSYYDHPINKAVIKTGTAECMINLYKYKSAETLLKQSVTLLKEAVGLEVHDDILQYFKSKITSNRDISEEEMRILVCLVDVNHHLSRVYKNYQPPKIPLAEKVLEESFMMCCMMLSVCRRDKQTGVYPVVDVDSLPGSIDVGKCSTQEMTCLEKIGQTFQFWCVLLNDQPGTLGEKAVLYGQKNLTTMHSLYSINTNHPQLALSHLNLGTAYQNINDFSNALTHCKLSSKMQIAVYGVGSNHPNIADSYSRIGSVCTALGDYTTALEYHKKALNMKKAVHGAGSNHPKIAASCNNFGSVCNVMGDYTTALEYYKKALDMMKAVHGADSNHPRIAISYNNIGSVYNAKGDYTTALEYHKKALDMGKAVYGADSNHPEIAISCNNIGNAYDVMGDYTAALEYYKKALDMMKAVHGADSNHPEIAISCNNIGNAYNAKGDYTKALEYCKKALDMRKAVRGADSNHADTADSYHNIGNVCYAMGDYTAALGYHKKALDMRKAVHGADSNHPHIAVCNLSIGNVYDAMGDYTTALEYYKNALSMMKAVHGVDSNHPQIATSYYSIAEVLKQLGDYVSSLSYYIKSLEMYQSMPVIERDQQKVAKLYAKIGHLLGLLGQYSQSSTCYSQSLAISVNSEHSKVASQTLHLLSDSLIDQSLYNNALLIQQIHFFRVGTNSDHTAHILLSAGRCYMHLCKWRKSWLYLYLALSKSSKQSTLLAKVHLSIGYLLLHLGHVTHSLEHSQLALDIFSSQLTKHKIPEYVKLYEETKILVDSLHLVKICQHRF